MMLDLRGNTNVVDYLDHRFQNWADSSGFGCDLLIRMELLTDLRSIIKAGKQFTEEEVLRIGRDICTALVLCHGNHILHRDIKPENIMVNKNGHYKLGNFGVSRILESTPTAVAMTGVGTPEYAAPEQFSGKQDTRMDIYSLGLILYELSNQNRLPFAASGYARQEDVQKRQIGVPLPRPVNAGDGLWRIIQKACAYKPQDRYATAKEMLNDLCRLGEEPYIKPTAPDPRGAPGSDVQTASCDYTTQFAGQQMTPDYSTVAAVGSGGYRQPSGNRKRNTRKWAALIAALVLAVGCGFAALTILVSKFVKETDLFSGETEPPATARGEPEESGEEAPELSTAVTESPAPPTTQPAVTAPVPVWNVGDLYTFGTFEQDNDSQSGEEPLTWIVLEVKDGNALLITERIIDMQPYNAYQMDVTWEDCSARSWLNEVFYSAAFSEEEKDRILETTVSTQANPYYGTDPGGQTTDHVFLLSLEEVEEYLPRDSSRYCGATQYAIKQGVYVNPSTGGSWWMLRTPGAESHMVMSINSDGSIDFDGGRVNSNKGGIRPVLWIKPENR